MTKKKKVPSPRVLRRLLDYNPETGELRWKARPVWMFKEPSDHRSRQWNAKKWNSRFAGKPAFKVRVTEGYFEGSIFQIKLLTHRVLWALHYGQWPEGHIDHINGVRDDNRISNLRDVSREENQRNTKRHVTNTSGVSGVCWDRQNQKWYASIYDQNRKLFLGYQDSFEDAVRARREAEVRLGYHPNHGRN